MHFDSFNDIQSRYQDTHIIYKGEAVYVRSVISEREDVVFRVIDCNQYNDYFLIKPYTDDKNDVVLDFSRPFFTTQNDRLYYVNRYPQRQWKQGFRVSLYRGICLDRGDLKRLNNDSRVYRDWANTALVPLDQVTSHLKENPFAVIATDVCVTLENKVYFKAKDVGFFYKGEIQLHFEGSWVKDHLDRSGIKYTVRDKSREYLNKTVSMFELEGAGVDGDILDNLVHPQEETPAQEQEPVGRDRLGFDWDAHREIFERQIQQHAQEIAPPPVPDPGYVRMRHIPFEQIMNRRLNGRDAERPDEANEPARAQAVAFNIPDRN